MSDLLLPCPFCGQKAYIRKRHHSMPRDPTYQAYCDDCGCGTSDLYRQPALAIQAWNQRTGRVAEMERQLAELQEIATERHALIAGPMARSSKLVGERYDAMKARITELERTLIIVMGGAEAAEVKLSLPGGLTVNCLRLRTCSERAKLEGERDTATRALAVLDRLAWLAAEEDSWFGDETDITVQRAAAERHRAALAAGATRGMRL